MALTNKKRDYSRSLDSVIRYTSMVGEHTTFHGSFHGGENIVVRGTVHGESDIQGAIVIAEGGRWFGHLGADVVVVVGYVEGDITAREKIELMNHAHVKGNLHSGIIAIETGAVHEGRIDMQRVEKLSRFTEKRETD